VNADVSSAASDKKEPSPDKDEPKTEKAPDPDRLKKVKAELQNILTLLDRE
jgi:hypothetical protein